MITSTNPAHRLDLDPRVVLDRAVSTGRSVIASVRPDQLGAPTPCPDMHVRSMLGHLVGVLDRITALGRGDDPFAVVEVTVADDAWVDAWTSAAADAAAAWSSDAVLERPTALPWIQGSGADVLTSYFSELTIHTWDLAVATGQRPAWDDAVVAAALSARGILPDEDRLAMFEEVAAAMGLAEVAVPFAEAVPVADDAPAIDRLVAWSGRDPRR